MTHNPIPDDDDLTEVTFMHTPRVDLVKKAANGYDFILAKSAVDTDPSLFTPEDVLDLAKTAQEGTMTDSTPADDTLTKDALDPENLLEEPDVDAAGDASDPGSAAWEAVDAARAEQAIELTVALKRLVQVAAEREGQEALVGDDTSDMENVWDLGDVLDQIDCILGVLAPFAVNEQTESEDRESDDASTSLVLKSGRTLSGANEQNIRQAQGLLETVLATLPAPVEDVAKATDAEEAPVTDTTTTTGDEPVTKAGEPQVLVYDEQGKVIGSVKPDAITTFAASGAQATADAATDADPSDDGTGDSAPADGGSDDVPADPASDPTTADQAAAATVPSSTDTAPAATDDGTVIPGTQTVQSPAPKADDEGTVTKSLEDIVKTALEELIAPIREKVAASGDVADLVKGLQERVDTMGRTPDDRRSPMLNGARGVAVAPGIGDEDPMQALTKAVDEAPNDAARHAALQKLAYASIKGRFTA